MLEICLIFKSKQYFLYSAEYDLLIKILLFPFKYITAKCGISAGNQCWYHIYVNGCYSLRITIRPLNKCFYLFK